MSTLTTAGITFGDATSQTTAATAAALVTTTNVLNATAGASAGAVGTYGFFTTASYGGGTPVVTFGNTTAGSGLRYAGAISQVNVGPSAFNFATASAPSGTWRAMGDLKTVSTNCGTGYGGTLFLRIS